MAINPKVIDISHHNRVASDGFQHARAFGILGVIHKASEGRHVVDATYAGRRVMAKSAGLLWGAYHFIRPGNTSAQVDLFLRTAQPDADTLLALDYEVDEVSLAEARDFIEQVERTVGRSVVVYSGNTIKEKLGSHVDPWWGARRLWLAQYSSHWVVQPSWSKPWLWQFTGDGHGPMPHQVPGIEADGGLDINHWDGTDDELRAQWTGAPAVAVSQALPPEIIAAAQTTRVPDTMVGAQAAPAQKIDFTALSQLLNGLAQLNSMLVRLRAPQAGEPGAPILSPIDKALGGEAMVGLKTPLAILAYASLWIMQAFDAVGPATGSGATKTAQVLTALIGAFGGLGLTAKLDRGIKALNAIAGAAQQLPPPPSASPKI